MKKRRLRNRNNKAHFVLNVTESSVCTLAKKTNNFTYSRHKALRVFKILHSCGVILYDFILNMKNQIAMKTWRIQLSFKFAFRFDHDDSYGGMFGGAQSSFVMHFIGLLHRPHSVYISAQICYDCSTPILLCIHCTFRLRSPRKDVH